MLTEIDEHISTTRWLKHHARMTASEAAGTVRTGRAMTHIPTVAARAVDGEIPPRSLQLLARARDKHREDFADPSEAIDRLLAAESFHEGVWVHPVASGRGVLEVQVRGRV